MSKVKSNIVYLHDVKNTSISDGKKITHEEYVIDGDKGLLIKYYHKEGDEAEKIIIARKGSGFVMKTVKGEKKDEKDLNKEELDKELSKNKKLKFAAEYVKALQQGGIRKRSRKGSKKVSKKVSKKRSRKGSKKGSKSMKW